ncbi:hypothetical protein HPCPY6271_1399 [Helicobacter pylori CPY6271]|nr:hypothetical protein HPCPY6271_1399 [Helicobacter pylori CPY6271]
MSFYYKKTIKTKRLKPYLLNIKVLSVNTGYNRALHFHKKEMI